MSDVLLTGSSATGEPNVASESMQDHIYGRPSHFQTFLIVAILVALCFVCYGSTLGDYLTCDDFMFLGYAHKVCQSGSWEWLRDLFTTPMFETQASALLYRPLPQIWFAGLYKIVGFNVSAFHLANLLLYSVTTVMVFLVSRKLLVVSQSQRPALVAASAAALFASYPLHVEVVPWVTEQIDMLCTLFFLSSVFFFIKAQKDKSGTGVKHCVSLFLALASMLCKEHGVMLPAVLSAYYFCCCSEGTFLDKLKRTAATTASFWIVLAGYFVARTLALGTPMGGYFGQSTDGLRELLDRWYYLHGFWQLVFPVNQKLVDWTNPIFSAFGALYLALAITFACAWRKKLLRKSQLKMLLFLALWTVISAIPPSIPWGLTESLSGSRHAYLLSVPVIIAFAAFFLFAIEAIRSQGKGNDAVFEADAGMGVSTRSSVINTAGIGLLIAIVVVNVWATRLNVEAWTQASNFMRDYQSSVTAAVKQLQPGKKLVLLYLPYELKGAHLFYFAAHADIFMPPFSSENLSPRIEFPIRTLFSNHAIVVNATQVRELQSRGYRFCYWDTGADTLRFVKIDLADHLDLPLQSRGMERASDKKVKRHVFVCENPDNLRRADFVEFRTRKIKPLKDNKKFVSCKLWWDASVEPRFVPPEFRNVIARIEPTEQFRVFHFPVSESKNWLCSQHTGKIYIDVPAELELETGSVRLIDGQALVPKLAFAGSATANRGVFRLTDKDDCPISYDGTAIAGIDHLILEISKPSLSYETQLGSLRKTRAKKVTASCFRLKNNIGTVTVPRRIFPVPASYSLRISARTKDEKLIGYFSDPVSVIFEPALW